MIYVSANIGSNANDGSITLPYATITKAISVSSIGDEITIFDGIYFETVNISSISGLSLYGIGNVIINGINRALDLDPDNFDKHQFTVDTDNNYIKNITIINSPCRGLRIGGNNNVFEDVNVYDCYLGFFIYGDNNEFIRCKAMYNYDYGGSFGDLPGQNSDGFSICGDYNIFRYCESAWNGDDGYDPYGQRGNKYYNCIAHHNGVALGCRYRDKSAYAGLTFDGNGNGFKLGPGPTVGGKVRSSDNIVERCLSYNNKGDEFDTNGGTNNRVKWCKAFNNAVDLSNIRAYRCAIVNPDTIYAGDDAKNYFTNCVAYPHDINYLKNYGEQINNSWNNDIVLSSYFESIDPTSEHFMHIYYGSPLNVFGIYDEGEGGRMPTLTQIKTWLNTEYPPSSTITDTAFVSRVNDIEGELYVILGNKLSNDYKLYDTDVTVANQLEYTLPVDCTIDNVKLLQVQDDGDSTRYNQFKYIGIANIPDCGRYYTKGSKGKYLLYENGKAITTTGLQIKIYYYNKPVLLSESNMDANPSLDENYQTLIKYKSAQKAAAAINDTTMANYWETEYQDFLKWVKDDLADKAYVAGEVNNQIESEW